VQDHMHAKWYKHMHVKILSTVTASQPQTAFSVAKKVSTIFIVRVTCNCGANFSELQNCLPSIFIPAGFGVEESLPEKQLRIFISIERKGL